MFLENKYTKWYFQLLENSKTKIYTGYIEKHHIIPKSLGGSNDKNNIVKLSAKEHFICHLLLVKMTDKDDKKKMIYALHRMSYSMSANQKRITNSREFNLVRNIISRGFTGEGNPMFGRTRTIEEIEKIRIGTKIGMSSSTSKIRVLTEKGRQAQRDGRLGWAPSKETREKWSRKRKGRPGNPNINKGKRWYTDGTNNILSKIQPPGYHLGRTV